MPSGAPEQVPGLLSEGLDIAREQKTVYIAYSDDQKWLTVLFEDGNEVTGSMLVGTDGPQLSDRSHLVEFENAKPTPIDFATMNVPHGTRVRELSSCVWRHTNRSCRLLRTQTAITLSCDLTLLIFIIRNLGLSRTICCFRSLENSRIRRHWPSTSQIKKQWLLSSLTSGEAQLNERRITPRQRGMAN